MHMCDWSFHLNEIVPTVEAKLPISSHVINFGTGVFESFRCYKSLDGVTIKGLDAHITRFQQSLITINLPPISHAILKNALHQYIEKNNITDAYIRLLGYPNGLCNVLDTINFETNFSIIGWHTPAPRTYNPISLNIAYLRRPNPNATLSRAKVSGLYVMDAVVQNNAAISGFDTGLILNEDGTICEAAGANIFIVKDNVLLTPIVNNSIKGITSKIIIDLAQSLNIPVESTPLIIEDLISADEAFITGTFYGVRPIKRVESFILKNESGKITKQLILALEDLISYRHSFSNKWMSKVENIRDQNVNNVSQVN